MPRHFWISASIALLVAAFALLGMALSRMALVDEARAPSSASGLAFQHQIVTYNVPPARAGQIQDALHMVLQGAEGVPSSGRAELASPGQLVVSAPPRMQASIRQAIDELAGDESGHAASSRGPVAVEMWLVEAATAPAPDESLLAPAKVALEEARARFGHRHYRLVDRGMIVSSPPEQSMVTGSRSTFSLRLSADDGQAVDASINVRLMEQGRVSQLASVLQLPADQWQLVGLLPNSGGDTPERLLLMRQTATRAPPTQEQ
jgi:hypothetical protein